MKDCKHKNKAYSLGGYSLTVNPPIHIYPWICKDCGFEGRDSSQSHKDDDYETTKQKFRKETQ